VTAGSIRCAPASLARGDSLAGTAVPQTRFLLIEDAGPWSSDAHPTGSLPPGAAEHLRAWAAADRARLLLIRRHGRNDAPRRRTWALADVATGVVRSGTASDDDLASLDPASDGRVVDGRWFLVCTHGRHDVCCAVDGRPVAHALSSVSDDVWECTHVGGDRFAANVLCLPSGAMYGRVQPSDAEALLGADARGEVLAHHLRGIVGRAAHLQVAEDAVRRSRVIAPLAGVRAIASVEEARGRWTVTVEHVSGVDHVGVATAPSEPYDRVSCSAAGPRRIPTWTATILTD
jgi:hypothetical protein